MNVTVFGVHVCGSVKVLSSYAVLQVEVRGSVFFFFFFVFVWNGNLATDGGIYACTVSQVINARTTQTKN